MTAIHGERVRLRPIGPADRARVREILASPEVARWWGDPDTETEGLYSVEEGYSVYVIEFDGVVVGLIQSCEEVDPQYRHAGIDISVHPDFHGRGVGTDAVRTLARHLLDGGHHRLTIDPAAANETAIRVYEKVGFRPVGVLRRYERAADGSWHDGLLMDLLAGELK
ncbi:GNAT family protein [Amycolatopsis sp. SID8362]|uniref:GNAT family N-acetyltransferase n=1 Tax=Amycolatopsis sp. SID8362 TaxID=2690346 RepID=UPI00136F1C14|nr:GNAT family protein [Amycolatopsis sp. SID8362]NBH07566.1 GNAT family N-acetyltransferase [Amycolatopsis sp. SID8362]NED44262.1 GNAT family N-acetyltransferase [Amycolatopsis sp. SID8362]